MSITISNCDQICHSPVNNSKAKMLYTFSKGDRFPKRRIIMCDKFYDVKENLYARATSLGFGHKYDFTKEVSKSPPPNVYNLKSDFDTSNKKKGFGFGYGRSQLEVTGPFVQTLKNKNPGPGTYELKNTLQKTTYTFKGKNEQEDHEKLKIPGPGSYPIAFALSQKGAYFLSKYKNCSVASFRNSPVRGKLLVNKIPGPGAYDLNRADFSPEGKYCLSKMPNVLTRRFGTSQRSNMASGTMTPGPGNYRLPSEFGYYVAKNVVKKPQTQQNSRKAAKTQEATIDEKQNIAAKE